MIRPIACICLCLVAASGIASAQTFTTINTDSGNALVFDQNTAASNPLTAGPIGDGNGDVIQLGYYTGATSAGNNFTGTWVPLTGQGSANTAFNTTSIGDRNTDTGNTNGTFSLQLNFGVDSTSNQSLPASGTILSIRFYNGTTLANSSFYNTVSDNAWVWASPAAPPNNPVIVMELDTSDAAQIWESIVKFGQASNTAFHTTIPIPEPSTYALLGVGALSLLRLRRRLKR